MNVSRNFMLIGVLYLLVGMAIGMHMGASGDHALAPAHAHINLLGFTLMTVFGLVYRLIPAMASSGLATIHFWLHQIGTLVLVILLCLLLTERITDAAMSPAAPISEVLLFVSVLVFGWNLLKNGR
jgi:cbb3-type cytochrome oxidase subunit 1